VFFLPGSGIRDRKKSGSGSGMSILDHFYEILKFFDADPDPGSGIFLNLDPGSGMEKFWSGINILDPQHWFAHWLMSCE
jgi:hypothetical protein